VGLSLVVQLSRIRDSGVKVEAIEVTVELCGPEVIGRYWLERVEVEGGEDEGLGVKK